MKRRDFVILLGGAVAAWPLAARAQQPRMRRVGVLETTSAALNAANYDAFRRGMQSLGYVEGSDFQVDYRSADGRGERFPELADLLRCSRAVLALSRVHCGTPGLVAIGGQRTPGRERPHAARVRP